MTFSNQTHLSNRRLVTACRNQYEIAVSCLDDLINEDHPARQIWAYIEKMEPMASMEKIKSVEGVAGRPAIDPKILISLWLYATVEGIGSAYVLSDYCKQHNGFKWLCGGISIDRKTLSNFRVNNGDAFDELLANGVAVLMRAGVVTLQEIAQDGLRVRASAGKHSFHRQKTIENHLQEARSRVKFLREELETNPGANKNRTKIAQMAAAQNKLEKLEAAQRELREYIEEKDQNRAKHRKKPLTGEEKTELRVSTTDPEARNMKMADGGFRPAYNVQFAVDTGSQVIVGVNALKIGNDGGTLLPMFEQIVELFCKVPARYLVDGGFKNQFDIKRVYEMGCRIFMPSEKSATAQKERVHISNSEESIKEWQTRMETAEAKEIYKRRASTVECVNAQARNRGLHQFFVRGQQKVKIIATLMAVTHNMVRSIGDKLI